MFNLAHLLNTMLVSSKYWVISHKYCRDRRLHPQDLVQSWATVRPMPENRRIALRELLAAKTVCLWLRIESEA